MSGAAQAGGKGEERDDRGPRSVAGVSHEPDRGRIVVSAGWQETLAVERGAAPGGKDRVRFPGEWGGYGTWDDPATGEKRPAHWQSAGWQPLALSFSTMTEEPISLGYGSRSHTVREEGQVVYEAFHGREGIVNMVRAGPSVAAVGTTTTVRIVAGGFDKDDAAAAKVWLLKDGNVVAESGPDSNPRVVEFDPANADRYRALEVDIEIPEATPLGVYDIAMRCGNVAVDMSKSEIPSDRIEEWTWPVAGSTTRALLVKRAMNLYRMGFVDASGQSLSFLEIPNSVDRDDRNAFRVEIADATIPDGNTEIGSGVHVISYSADGAEIDRLSDVRLGREGGNVFRTAASVQGIPTPVEGLRLVVWDDDPPDTTMDSEGKDASKTTLLAEIGGTIAAEYHKNGFLVGRIEAPVCDPEDVRIVYVHAVILMVPGEGGGLVKATEPEKVKEFVEFADRVYWQCCVRIELLGEVEIRMPPDGVDLEDGFDCYGITYDAKEWTADTCTADERALFGPGGLRDSRSDTVDMFFVNGHRVGTGLVDGGYAYRKDTPGLGPGGDINSIVLTPFGAEIVAHELLHVLTAWGHTRLAPAGYEDNLFDAGLRITDVEIPNGAEYSNQEQRIRSDPSGVLHDRQ